MNKHIDCSRRFALILVGVTCLFVGICCLKPKTHAESYDEVTVTRPETQKERGERIISIFIVITGIAFILSGALGVSFIPKGFISDNKKF